MTDLEKINQKYKDQKYIEFYEEFHMKPFPKLHNINGLDIPFDPLNKNIGIMFSGGVDSTLLTYILCNIIQDINSECKIHFIHLIRFYYSKPWIEYNTKKVYEWFKKRYPDIVQDFNVSLIPEELEIVKISAFNNYALDCEFNSSLITADAFMTCRYQDFYINRLNLDFIYGGTTLNPPINHIHAPEFRDIENILDTLNASLSGTVINPFYFVMKDWIMAQYNNYCLHDLYNLTRSCEADYRTLGEEWKNIKDQTPPVCGVCFFCKEREWGIENKNRFVIV